MKQLFRAAGLVIALTIAACNANNAGSDNNEQVTGDDVAGEMKEAMDTTEAFLARKRQETIMNYYNKLSLIETELNGIKADLSELNRSAKRKAMKQIENLDAKYTALENDLSELEDSSREAWSELKTGVESALEEIEDSIDAAKKEFESKS